MTTLDNIDDLLRIVREDEAVRAELRREVLTEDLLRATEHARILRSATGLDAYAVVASVRMAPSMEGRVYDDVEQFVHAGDENAALWYRLDEERMEPQDPE